MMWNYSTLLISHEDRKRAAKPKKYLAGFFAAYGSVLLFLKLRHDRNKEVFYKRYLFTVLTPVLAIMPLVAIY